MEKAGKEQKNSWVSSLILIAAFLVIAFLFQNAFAMRNYAWNNLTATDLKVCAENNVYDTADCLIYLQTTNKKDTTEGLIAADPIFKYLNSLINNGGNS